MDTKLERKQLRPQELLVEEEGSISSLILINPTVLDIYDPDVIEAGMFYLPYSTGFEIECDKADEYVEECFTSIPNIMEVKNSNSEQRYRIPNGIRGIVCLYNIAHQLQINSIKTQSGIHYHIDCTDLAERDMYVESYFKLYEDLILGELDIWNYAGTYNRREISDGGGHTWMRMNRSFKTLEFRIGEMTFDYKVLLKRIVHLNGIVRHVKNGLITEFIKKNHPILKYEQEDSIENILKNRTKKI